MPAGRGEQQTPAGGYCRLPALDAASSRVSCRPRTRHSSVILGSDLGRAHGGGSRGKPGFPGVLVRRDHGLVRVLVTADRGTAGVLVAGLLRHAGHEVAGFDRADGADVPDLAAIRRGQGLRGDRAPRRR
jgi:hypothetical protein